VEGDVRQIQSIKKLSKMSKKKKKKVAREYEGGQKASRGGRLKICPRRGVLFILPRDRSHVRGKLRRRGRREGRRKMHRAGRRNPGKR
jgi:hypothetical protein